MTLAEHLSAAVREAFVSAGLELESNDVSVVPASRPEFGDFQCNDCLKLAKQRGRNPRELAQAAVDVLLKNELFLSVSVDGPGFINLSLTDEALAQFATTQLADDRLGVVSTSNPQKVFVDYGGLNVAKAMHVGHLRASVIGQAVKLTARFVGDEVIGDVHLGDWGTHIGIVLMMIQDEQPDLPYFQANWAGEYPADSPVTITDLDRIYPLGSLRGKEDEVFRARALRATLDLQQGDAGLRALWAHVMTVSLATLRTEVARLKVDFEEWNGESTYNDRLPALIADLQARGVAYESRGAQIIPVGESIPPLILLKSDGAYLYATTDLATIQDRVERGAQRIDYVVDSRQSLHFDQVFIAARMAGIAPADLPLRHFGFGTVNGPDGRPFKTRSGGVMKLAELMDEAVSVARQKMEQATLGAEYSAEERAEIAEIVGIAALKFGDLINHRASDYIFDLERFTSFEGKTGPYLLYTAVRIRSIVRKLPEVVPQFAQQLHPLERAIILKAAELSQAVYQAYSAATPHTIAEYAYTMAQAYNAFYAQCSLVHAQNDATRASWMATSRLAERVITLCCGLLGIEVPEKM